MGYDELKEAREKRAETEAATKAKGKGKRGRKRTNAALEADAAELKPKAARVSKARKLPVPADEQMSRTLVAEDKAVGEPWRALVARMY